MRRMLATLILCLVCLGAGLVGGYIARGAGFDPFGLGRLSGGAEEVIRANSGAIDSNQRAIDAIDRILGPGHR
jgi:hypothetical protein